MSEERTGFGCSRRGWLVTALVVVGLVAGFAVDSAAVPSAAAADPTASMSIQKVADPSDIVPGQAFTYTIQVQCTAGTVNGCVNATVTDTLPQYVSLNQSVDDIVVTGQSTFQRIAGPPAGIRFTDSLGGGQTGLLAGRIITITVPVIADDDIPVSANGQPLTNTATITADNANPKSSSAVVVPTVPPTLDAQTTKSFDQHSAPAVPGTPLSMDITGTNTSNVPVDTLVITDPVDPEVDPNPFDYLRVVDLGAVDLPDGAETVQVDAYVNGVWVPGPVGPPAALPATVDPADITGLRFTFTSTTDPGIQPDATAHIAVDLEQRDDVADIPDGTTVTVLNTASTEVTSGDDSATSDPAQDIYKIGTSAISVGAQKSFNPKVVNAGDRSTVTLGATNNSAITLDSMTITEPAAGSLLAGLTLVGIGSDGNGAGIIWPTTTEQASVTYTGPGCDGVPLTTTTQNTLPAPPAGCTVTQATVTFTGQIASGAQATVPFVVQTPEDQPTDVFERLNIIRVDGTVGGRTSSAHAAAVLETIVDRIAVDVDKTVSPDTMPAYPGQIAIVQLTGELKPFPDSTVDASTIIVQDPAVLPDTSAPAWFTIFQPQSVTATPVPACSTLTVQYTTDPDGAEDSWQDISPELTDIEGPTIVNEAIPDDISASAAGIRFVYTAAPAGGGCEGGFPPSTEVGPNVAFGVRPDVTVDADTTYTNCSSSAATSPTTPQVNSGPVCDDIVLTPVNPGTIDPIDKKWDQHLINARSQTQVGATLSWSTAGYTGLAKAVITDTQDPDVGPLTKSVFDTFDLVRIDPITATDDPVLTYDQISKVELYQLPAEGIDPTLGHWVDAPGDPCPLACDGTFPGYTLSAADQAVTIGFRLTYAESPTRDQRLDATAPPVGTGVAPSTGNNRHIHPVFQLRDERRSDPTDPVTAEQLYNTETQGLILNTVRASGYFDPDGDPVLTVTDGDTIQLDDIPVTVNSGKSWTGGPLGVPDPGVPQDEWPTAPVTLTATNTTPAKIDQLMIDDDTAGTMFEAFNLTGFTAITDPASIGATGVVISLTGATPGTYTRDDALALTESELTGVTHINVTYTGRININALATVSFGTRLRTEGRTSEKPPEAGTTIDNRVTVTGSDPIGYPTDPPATSTANATIDLVAQGIGVTASKSFDPTSQTEPDNAPVTVTVGGQPSGPSRTFEMVLTDADPRLWNQYDLVANGLNNVTFTYPIDQVQVDALTGGTWSVVGGEPVLTGATWQIGSPTAGPALTLPTGVVPADVQGLRYTFTRADGANWENPATPNQTIGFRVQRRAELHTGGPVPSNLNPAVRAPGETVAGRATNAMTADVTSHDVDAGGDPLTAHADATATIDYLHGDNSVTVTKSPVDNTLVSPAVPFTYTLTSRNDGAVDITNPVITDTFPADAGGPQIVLADDPGFTFTPVPTTIDMPSDAADVTISETSTGLVFTFPDGSALPPGATYTITFQAVARAGLPANTQMTNTFGISGDRPWDHCNSAPAVGPTITECSASEYVTMRSAGALSVQKLVKAEGSDELGVTTDPSALTRVGAVNCTADADGFYARPCVPIAQPGGLVTWRLHFVNSGNRPIDRLLAIDSLPAVGDTLATDPSLARGSQWRPLLEGTRPNLVDPAFGTMTVYYTTGASGCDGPVAADGALLCPDIDWVEWPAGENLPVDPASVTGLQFELIPQDAFAPAATTDVDIPMSAPAVDPAADYSAPQTDPDGQSYNSIGDAGRYISEQGGVSYTLVTEPPRVGVALARGPLAVEKVVTGDGARYAPSLFLLHVQCSSDGVPVPLPLLVADRIVTPGVPQTINNLPWGAECSLTESDGHGQTSSSSEPATVVRADQTIGVATITNVYELSSLAVTKTVDSDAVDGNGAPIPYGPFTVTVDCTFLGSAVYADGYGPGNPMVAVLADGATVTFSGLPAGASSAVAEADTDGAASTTIAVVTPSTSTTTGGSSTTVELEPGASSAAFTNTYTVGAVTLTKVVTGDAAAAYGAGPFTMSMTCTLADPTGATRTVWSGVIVLGGANPLSATVQDLATGALCQVQETDAAHATSSSIDPAGGVTVGDGTTVTFTVTNRFDGAQIVIDKVLDGDNTGIAPATFPVQVDCTIDGAPLQGFPMVVNVTPGTPVTIDVLTGATCTARETDSGAATSVTYSPAGADGGSAAVSPTPGSPSTITITNRYDSGPLPITGGDIVRLVAAVVVLLGGGGALLILARRRRRRRPSAV